MIVAGLGSGVLMVAGLGLLVVAPEGLWSRLLGLQWAAMGLYLLALVRLGRADLLRMLLPLRLGLAAGAAALGVVWLAVAEGAWAVLSLWRLSDQSRPDPLTMPSRAHSLLLGLFPLTEGAACLLLADQASALLYVQPAVQPWAVLFGLQSLYLGAYWWVCVAKGCASGLAVTIIGRLLVAGTFAALWWTGADLRVGLLAAALVVSCVWSAAEAAGWLARD